MGAVNLTKQTVNLTKNQVVNLSKQSEGLKKIMIALGWDENTGGYKTVTETVQPGFFGKLFGAQARTVEKRVPIPRSGYDYDLDAWVGFMKNGEVRSTDDVCYYGRLNMSNINGQFAHHHGDNLTGAGDGDDEQITIDLDKIPDKYNGMVVGVTIYQGKSRNQKFGDISNLFVRVVDQADNFEICRYADSISDEYSKCLTFIVGKLYKDKGEWQFKSAGYGTKDDSISDAIRNYKG